MASVIARSERRVSPAASALVGLETWWPPAPHTAPPGVPQRSGQIGGPGRAGLARAVLEARVALEEAVVAAAVAAQRAIDVAKALDEALAVLTAAEPARAVALTPPRDTPRGVDVLSPREWEVLALVAEGRSNKAIATALSVSPNTVKTHVASLLSKLDAGSRAQLAAIAARAGMPNRGSDSHTR